jgi:hypothetical protein
MGGVWDHRPSNGVGVGAVGAGAAEPLELVFESFVGAIMSVEKVSAVKSSVATRRSGWHRWRFPSLAAPLSDRIRVRSVGGEMVARRT